MLVVVKKCKFFTKKIDFIRFIIKLDYISIDLKKSRSYSKLAGTREYYIVKIISRVL